MITFWAKLRIPTTSSFQSAINDSDIMYNFEMNFMLREPLLLGKTNDTLDNQIKHPKAPGKLFSNTCMKRYF